LSDSPAIAPLKDRSLVDVAGFDTTVPAVIADFDRE
jgi:hypothetical protein